jgi:hypothetical protein
MNVVPVALGEIDRVVAPDDAGIVDQNIDPLVRKHVARRHRVGEIEKQFACIRHLPHGLVAVLASGRRRDLRPGAAHGDRDRLTDARIGAGHQGALARQAKNGLTAGLPSPPYPCR